MTNQTTVSFSVKQQAKHAELKRLGLSSQDFSKFVHSAFAEKVDRMNVQKLAFQKVAEETRKAVESQQ